MSLFEKLAAEENKFQESQFLSPVVRGQQVRVRIAGIVMSLNVTEPSGFHGWGIFKPTSYRRATLVRQPTLAERSRYLNLFPAVRMVVCHRKRKTWFGIPANQADAHFNGGNEIPIVLAENIQRFDTVVTRFDGQRFWFEKTDPRRSSKIAKDLRQNLSDKIEPKELNVANSNAAEREVYGRAILRSMLRQKDTDEDRIQRALKRAGASYRSHREIGDSFTVTYTVNGEVHRSTVEKQSLSVQSAGICLTGMDANFDLQSLVGVIREGQRTDQINAV